MERDGDKRHPGGQVGCQPSFQSTHCLLVDDDDDNNADGDDDYNEGI